MPSTTSSPPRESAAVDDVRVSPNGLRLSVSTGAEKGQRTFTIADADTHNVRDRFTIGGTPRFGRGIRPFHAMPNKRKM